MRVVRAAVAVVFISASAAAQETAPDDIPLDAPSEEIVAEPDAPAGSGPAEDALGAAEEADGAEEQAPPAASRPGVRPPASARQPRLAAMRIVLRSIDFTPSAYLDEAALAKVRAAWLGRAVDAAGPGGLDGLLAAVDALYREKGIAFAYAAVGGTDPAAGRVSVELVEARLAAVRYEGGGLSDAYLDYRLGFKPGDLADNRLIHARLERLSLTDGVQFNADFQTAAPGRVDLVVTAAGNAPVGGHVAIDNFGKRATGTRRLSAGVVVRGLTGWNDPLSLSGAVTHGSQSASLSYSRVVHPLGTRLTAFVEGARSQTLRDPVLRSRSFLGEIGLSHPFLMRPDLRLTGSVSALGFGERGTILGVPLVSQDGYGVRFGSSQFANGDGWFVSTGQTLTALRWNNRQAGLSGLGHVDLQANVAAAVRLGDDHLFSLQAAGQLSFDANTPAKFNFGVAGPAGVRGYDQDVSSSDTGFYVRAQIERSTPLPLGIEGLAVRPFVFADIGRSYEFAGGSYLPLDLLAGAGAGMSVVMGRHLSGDIFVARPLKSANGFRASGHEIRVSLTASF